MALVSDHIKSMVSRAILVDRRIFLGSPKQFYDQHD